MITKEQIKNEIDSLEDNQALESVYQLIQRVKNASTAAAKKHSREAQQKAMAEFCGTFDELDVNSVEDEMRLIRKGRRRLWDDI